MDTTEPKEASPPQLRIGHMPYANSLVFYSRLRRPEYDLVTLPPRNMAQALATWEIDAGPLPIYEVLRMGDTVSPLGDLGVAADGPARSVLLFSTVRAEELSGESVAVTSHTSTSIQLLRILMRDLWNVSEVEFRGPNDESAAKLLIGDAALAFLREDSSDRERYQFLYDLSVGWKTLTGMPFVFALWVARSEVDAIRFMHYLYDSYYYGIEEIDKLAESVSIPGYNAFEISLYIRNFTYQLDDPELAAIEEFRSRLETLPEWNPPVMPYDTPRESRLTLL